MYIKVKNVRGKKGKNTVNGDSTVEGAGSGDCVRPHSRFSWSHQTLSLVLLWDPFGTGSYQLPVRLCLPQPCPLIFSSPPTASCSGHLHVSPGSPGDLKPSGENLGLVGFGN